MDLFKFLIVILVELLVARNPDNSTIKTIANFNTDDSKLHFELSVLKGEHAVVE